MKTLKQFAKDNCISVPTAYRQIKEGKLTAVKIGRKTVVRPEDEAAFRAALQPVRARAAR